MKRIRKIETSVGLTGNVVNNKSTSTSNAYSCDYINNDLKALILDMAHPIGSYYWSSDSTNPHDLFGGTWVQIKDKFIIAVGDSHTVGQSYGSNTKNISHTHSIGHTHGVPGVAHTHTSAAHTHTINGHTHTSAAHTHTTGNHTLTIAELPSHNHKTTTELGCNGLVLKWDNQQSGSDYFGAQYQSGSFKSSGGFALNQLYTSSTGSGTAHNHGNTGSTTPGKTGSTSLTTNSTTPGATGSTTPSATTTNSQSTSTSGSGGSTALDITPACEAAYCWKRTA